MKPNKTQSGYTLIESIAVIAILTAVVGTIIKTISHMHDRYRVSRLTSQIVELEKAINTRFSASEDYSSLTAKLIKDEKLAPSDINWGGSSTNPFMTHKFGGNITISTTGASPHEYTITFTNIPVVPCVELATQNWAHNQYSNLSYMEVNDNKLEWITSSEEHRMPIPAAAANDFCNSELNNTIKWTFQ